MRIRRMSPWQLYRRVRDSGVSGIAQRLAWEAYRRFDGASVDFVLREQDIADSRRLRLVQPTSPVASGQIARVGWVCTPPGPGSGGHTTLFRMVAGLEALGTQCTLFLYDPRGGDVERHRATIRTHWPHMLADVRDATAGITGVDAAIASSWETAHVLASHSDGPLARLYFVQDYEPFFYPHGATSALAEDTYRFGFRTIALGHMVASHIAELGVDVDVAPFGCDTDVYSLSNTGARAGVVCYAKPGNHRRGYLLAKLALTAFHRRHPEQEIHVYGEQVRGWDIPITQHGKLAPAELNDLYNRSIGGLALSFTNISLVAEEMLAAGTIPIVNDSPDSRADLPNEHVEWALPTVGGIADALSRVVEGGHPDRSARAAGSVRRGWGPAQGVVAAAVSAAVSGSESPARGASSGLGRVDDEIPHLE